MLATAAPRATPAGPTVRLKRPHTEQLRFLRSRAMRRVIRAGRRSGKTTGLAIYAVEEFLKGERVLYAVPTAEQVGRFWAEVSQALAEPIAAGLFKKNETVHIIERPGTEQRIRAKTAWSADTLRGDYCTRLILDEWQLCNEEAWSLVGAPMMLDKPGSVAIFCYTPPSIRTASVSKAYDKLHAAKLFKAAQADTTGRWATFHFSSHANPHISAQALADITQDMSVLAQRREILAEDVDEVEGSLWKLTDLEACRVRTLPPLTRVVVAIDPGHTAGIIVAGRGDDGHGYVLDDVSTEGPPEVWAEASLAAYAKYHADCIVPERNHGGEMVESMIRHLDRRVPVKTVWASHGKYARAEPVSVLYASTATHPVREVHHVGFFPELEEEMVTWLPVPGAPSPNRMDALVWGLTDLLLTDQRRAGAWGRR